jgi:5-methylcytosine-specific restriction endonuclease McrA
MARKVLVLNQDYTAFTVCTVPKAFLLVYLNKAEMVLEDARVNLRTVTRAFPMPSVIRLNRYVNRPFRHGGVVLNRHNVFKRDSNKCQYCQSTKDLTLDHVYPKSRGGKTSWDNLVTACKHCNARKGDFTPEEAGMLLIQQPFKPSFVMLLREFGDRINEDWLLYLGQKQA